MSSVPLWPLPAQYRLLTRQGSDVGGNESAIGQRPMFPIDPPHVFRIPCFHIHSRLHISCEAGWKSAGMPAAHGGR
jgi:hypothetical protein